MSSAPSGVATKQAQTERANQMLAQLVNGCAQLVMDTGAETAR